MSTHMDTLAEWWNGADNDTVTHPGDTIIMKGRKGFDVFEIAHEDTAVHISALPNCRLLHRAPAPKPAWHDAVAVLANHRGYEDGPRTVWTRELDPDGHDWSDARTAMAAPHHLVNVTPLIEAKVTDEMVKRAEDWYAHSSVLNDPVEDVLGILTAALGLETA